MGILAGVYIGFGALLMLSVGGACPGLAATNPGLKAIVSGVFGLPCGLLMVLLAGAELFTGNTALVTAALIERRATASQLLKSLSVSYLGNLVGSLALAALAFHAGMLGPEHAAAKAAVAKTSLAWVPAFVRGILCNWLVCMAIWLATAATTLPGKALAVMFPIPAFVAMGLEHSVANMFIIPAGILAGAPVSWSAFFTANLLPVTLGNTVAGAVCVALAYAFVFGRLGQRPAAAQ